MIAASPRAASRPAAPAPTACPGAWLNDISAPGQEFGIVGYTHAGGVDRPLVVWKGGDVVVPHTNWRGVYGKGANPGGGVTTVPVEWPEFKTTAESAQADCVTLLPRFQSLRTEPADTLVADAQASDGRFPGRAMASTHGTDSRGALSE